jgi:hypothetical protein
MFGNKYGKISCATFTVNSLTADADAVLFSFFFFFFIEEHQTRKGTTKDRQKEDLHH